MNKNVIIFFVVIAVLITMVVGAYVSLGHVLNVGPTPVIEAPAYKMTACGSGLCVEGNVGVSQNGCLAVYVSTSSPAIATFCGSFGAKFN